MDIYNRLKMLFLDPKSPKNTSHICPWGRGYLHDIKNIRSYQIEIKFRTTIKNKN